MIYLEKIRIGKVTTINNSKGTAKVYFEDTGLVSTDLPIIVPFSLTDKIYYMPKINEVVLCAFTDDTNGFILGSFYANTRETPYSDNNIFGVKFDDTAEVRYDKNKKELFIKAERINFESENMNIK